MSSRNFLNIAKSICCSFIFRKMNKNKVKSFYLGILILVCASHPYTFWLGRGFNF